MQCTAKSKRSKERCQKWAVRGRTTCRMHGGVSIGLRTKVGKVRARIAVLRHGGHTKAAKAQHREVMALIRKSKDFLRFLG
jgi:hypothetical protein